MGTLFSRGFVVMIFKKEKTMCTTKELLNKTTAYCGECDCSHDASVMRENDDIFFIVNCKQIKKTKISSDADLFIKHRNKSAYQHDSSLSSDNSKWGYIIDITQACNFTCPICFNACNQDHDEEPVRIDKILQIANKVTQGGRKVVLLSGGEPTLHPDLTEIVSTLTKRGFTVNLASNGLKFAQDKDLINDLKKAGLKMVFMQMDTMEENVHIAMRGNNFIHEKKLAAKIIIEAKVRLSLVLTAVSLNMPGIGEIISFCGSLSPGLSLLTIQVASPSGRFDLPRETLIDRESVIKAICDSSVIEGATEDCFWPQPHFAPWRSFVHPDCSGTLLLMTENGRLKLFGDYVDLDLFYSKLNRNTMNSNMFTKNLVPLYYLIKCTHKKFRLKVLLHFLGFASQQGRHGVMAIIINNFMRDETLDESRLERCETCFLSASGISAGCLITTPRDKQLNK